MGPELRDVVAAGLEPMNLSGILRKDEFAALVRGYLTEVGQATEDEIVELLSLASEVKVLSVIWDLLVERRIVITGVRGEELVFNVPKAERDGEP